MKKRARPTTDRMVSGKLRRKAGRAGASGRLVAVDGTDFTWAHRHGWHVWGKGIRVISISVSLHPERTRELILDLSVKLNDPGDTPSDARLLGALDAGIRAAREAGWDPESRGRAFRLEIAEDI